MSTISVTAIDSCLPQTQCRLCGYDDCLSYAKAITYNNEDLHLCAPGGLATKHKLEHMCSRTIDQSPVEFQEHVVRIDEDNCIGCVKCIHACPVSAIVGAPKKMHSVLTNDCTGCDLCLPVCPVDCIHVEVLTTQACRYTGNALAQTYDFRRQQYNNKQNYIPAKKKRKQTYVVEVDTTKQMSGRRSYQKTRIEKAIALCRKNGDTAGVIKLELQLDKLSCLKDKQP